MYSAPTNRSTAAYRQVDVETRVHAADAHQLIQLCFDELLKNVRAARHALGARDLAAKGAAIGKAVRVIDEGLRPALDMKAGGELAMHLRNLYDCMVVRLTTANLHNDAARLDEVESLLLPVRDAWAQIRKPGAAAVPGRPH